MSRVTVDELHGYNFQVNRGEQPVVDEQGRPIHDAHGLPKMQTVWVLVLVDPQTGHRVVVPFTEEGKTNLLKSFTGGIIVAKGNGDIPA